MTQKEMIQEIHDDVKRLNCEVVTLGTRVTRLEESVKNCQAASKNRKDDFKWLITAAVGAILVVKEFFWKS